MTTQKLINFLNDKNKNPAIVKIYGHATASFQIKRLKKLLDRIKARFPDQEVSVFRAPGRTELGGNHTDHNHGRVLAASIDLDIMAAVVKTDDNRVTLSSVQYKKPYVVGLSGLKRRTAELHTTEGLVRGIAYFLNEAGWNTGGFHAELESMVGEGSGLSSSAAVEILIGSIFNGCYNDGKIRPLALAQTGQKAENGYYGKPCGLMDQLASVWGGAVSIDFADPKKPVVGTVPFDLDQAGYSLVIVGTGGEHASLTGAYRAITDEMRAVALHHQRAFLREISLNHFLKSIPALRKKTGDRAVLRAIHFYDENERVQKQLDCLERCDFQGFLKLVKDSRDSSWEKLQNCYLGEEPRGQGISLALALSDVILQNRGASRVHGGGFQGTIQCYVGRSDVRRYTRAMESVFGKGSVVPITICPCGAVKIF